MRYEQGSVQRSFRVSTRTMELLEDAAAYAGESRNALVDRLLGESVRVERHPLIRFHQGASGRRQPLVIGTRLYVHQVISTVRASKGGVDAATSYFGIEPRLVQAAVEYYADFSEEVDGDSATAARIEAEERSHWERAQRALA